MAGQICRGRREVLSGLLPKRLLKLDQGRILPFSITADGAWQSPKTQYGELQQALDVILTRLRQGATAEIKAVWAVGDWASTGVDLRNLPYDDVVIEIVVQAPEVTFELYQQFAKQVFADLPDDEVFVQFRLATAAEWSNTQRIALPGCNLEPQGVPLLVRA